MLQPIGIVSVAIYPRKAKLHNRFLLHADDMELYPELPVKGILAIAPSKPSNTRLIIMHNKPVAYICIEIKLIAPTV